MPDSKQKTGSPDRDRININEDHELRDWATRFGVGTNELNCREGGGRQRQEGRGVLELERAPKVARTGGGLRSQHADNSFL